jgi:hypothetical protein
MVGHQTICIRFGDGRNMFPVLIKKKPEVAIVAKHIFKSVGVVENMVRYSRL